MQARKKLAEAEKVQQRAVTIAENVYGPHHAQVGGCLIFASVFVVVCCCCLSLLVVVS